MKKLFLTALVLLLAASAGTYFTQPQAQSRVPVLHWITGTNPERVRDAVLFHDWLRENGHVTGDGRPIMELRLDTANRNVQKQIIQGVSGVGGDLMDLVGGGQLRYFHEMGLLEDVTEEADRMGFDTSRTFDAVVPDITIDGRQYMFPCNISAHLLWTNKDTFARYNQPLPPRRWTFETFEEMGRRFVEAANPPGEHQTVFYLSHLETRTVYRSLGLSAFNETLTRCTFDDPRFAEALATLYRWTYDYGILPSAADKESFSTEAGFGGAIVQLFNSGNYAMFPMGRYALVQLREFGDLDLGLVEPPYGQFPNTRLMCRGAVIYAGGDHRDLAAYFLEFLASESYNMRVVENADALPPNPVYTRTEAFRRPPDPPEEWGCHEPFAWAAEPIAIGGVYSPFVSEQTVRRAEDDALQVVMSELYSPEEAGRRAAERVNDEIQRNLHENPKLQPRYEELLKRQREIDALRAAGRPVPPDWIRNPFLKRYEQWNRSGRQSPPPEPPSGFAG